jgi:hypothetical protein
LKRRRTRERPRLMSNAVRLSCGVITTGRPQRLAARTPASDVHYPAGLRSYADISPPRTAAELAIRIEELERSLWTIATGLRPRLSDLAGLLVGDFSDMRDHDEPFGENVREIILKHTAGYEYPVAFGFPAGHEELNVALPLGAEISLKVTNQNGSLKFTG